MALEGYPMMTTNNQSAVDHPQSEIIYHVFERSFYDSNGDQNGDLNGLRAKLDYLQQLGITTILVTPVFQSVYYHNYFADDFEKIDPSYGTMQDWINLVKDIHERGMKLYLDMEIQYVTDRQLWYKDSYKNPQSAYSDYIIYHDSANTKPEPIIYNISTLIGYNDSARKVATVNLYNPHVQDYFYKLFKYWMAPEGDDSFKGGVDGFRLDHMMDDLDDKGVLSDLFAKFWCPLITKLKTVNPHIKIIAEQGNWASFGMEYFEQGCVDCVFAFNLQQAIESMDKSRISEMANATFSQTPDDKQQIVFIENHDMERFASVVGQNAGKVRIGAAFNLLIGGIPCIYYGQELGMFGKGGFEKFGDTDGNDIPQREAFEWFKDDSRKGMAVWYKNSGPWWDDANLTPHDGISLEEEQDDPGSLWNFYKTMISLYRSNSAFFSGKYSEVNNDNDGVFSFLRHGDGHVALVVISLSDHEQRVTLDMENSAVQWSNDYSLEGLYGNLQPEINEHRWVLHLPSYTIQIWKWH